MTKKVIAFDLDDTLCVSKSPITQSMGEYLCRLLDKYDVCIISGGAFPQFKTQVIDLMDATPEQYSRLHIMPTSGTRYFKYNAETSDWVEVYSNELTDDQRQRTINAFENGAKSLGLWEENTYGDIIEDRGSQITFSALGQQAPPDLKHAWDPDGAKREELRKYVAEIVPDLEVRAGGSTSVDVTLMGIDKAYGMRKLCEVLGINKDDILFIGDRLQPGGNDYPVKADGIDTIEVHSLAETESEIDRLVSNAF